MAGHKANFKLSIDENEPLADHHQFLVNKTDTYINIYCDALCVKSLESTLPKVYFSRL